jgi:signal transduction histidine kinase
MNPAYMTRQVHELAKEVYGVHGHITSLSPIRPQNAPDRWEARALEAFERGEEEVSSVEEIEGETHMRLMRPLITAEDCLKCHASQGYKVGDVRGGISVAVSMAPLWAVERDRMLASAQGHGLTWLIGFVGIGLGARRLRRQVDRRKEAEESLRQANRKLVELESLKEDLANMLVHDMKNPVANTMLAVDMIELESESSLTQIQREYILMARRNQFKLSEMMVNLLEISRLESGAMEINMTSFDVLDLIDRIIARYTAITMAEEKAVQVEVDPGAGRITCDQGLLDRILTNILSNAIKHSHPNGEISIQVTPAKERRGVLFSVRDFGEGIPKESQERIFEKFYQAEMREMGLRNDTGLGLTFCKMAVELLGGDIWVESEEGEGSRFSFVLPDTL